MQFGYVVLFSSAFPLAAMCALINNIIEIRGDAFKLCTGLQRPFGIRVESIGQWQVRRAASARIGEERRNSDLRTAKLLVVSLPDCDGGHGPDCHHSELLPDWSVRSAAAALPVAQSGDGHHLHRHPRGMAQSASASAEYRIKIY